MHRYEPFLKATRYAILAWLLLLLPACSGRPWNHPYSRQDDNANIYYTYFTERPKFLDPAKSYSSDEWDFITQVYEPPFQYHYLKRPFELVPLTAESVPSPTYLDGDGNVLPNDTPTDDIKFSTYEITIKPGIVYHAHPALARNDDGSFKYHNLDAESISQLFTIWDREHLPVTEKDTRELVAADYVHQIKRLAHPGIESPILGHMAHFIVGLGDLATQLGPVWETAQAENKDAPFVDLEPFQFEGAEVVDKYTYRVKIYGKYPQFVYWLAMPFFAAMPPEADRFHAQKGLKEQNIILNWWPIGTGPYILKENNPNRRMVLERNPLFREELYPNEGAPGDAEAGLLEDAGEPLPFFDQAVFVLEKETIPRWNKFLQGYFDRSGISSDDFDAVVSVSGGDSDLTPTMKEKGIELAITQSPLIRYWAFNMKDPVVGGYDEKARKLRHALSIAFDVEEYISIFYNERGSAAMNPIPKGIFGSLPGEEGINPIAYDWVNGRPKRKSLDVAKALLAEAGYPDGRDAETGEPLSLYFDTASSDPATLNWMRKQFRKLNIDLIVRTTDYGRFREKVDKANFQILYWGWNADYPDPENFLFLLYGPNSRFEKDGENTANYKNERFDELFEEMKVTENGERRQKLISEMHSILQKDAPWIWGVIPQSFGLSHQWIKNYKPNNMARNTLKYRRIDVKLRNQLRREWNQPVAWPILVGLIVLVITIIPAWTQYMNMERETAA